MQNKCNECNGSLEPNQIKCPYCGTVQQNFDEQLLNLLTALKRKYELASSRGNKLIAEPLLADEYTYVLSDGGVIDEPLTKNEIIKNLAPDKNFNSYNIYNEELLERSGDKVVMSCIQNTVRLTPHNGEFCSYLSRTKLIFVNREGNWQIASENCVSIDEKGEEIL